MLSLRVVSGEWKMENRQSTITTPKRRDEWKIKYRKYQVRPVKYAQVKAATFGKEKKLAVDFKIQ